MKLATVRHAGVDRPAFIVEGRAILLSEAFEAAGRIAPASTLALVEREDEGRADLEAAWRAAEQLEGMPARSVHWRPPVRGYKIVSTAINNAGVAKLAAVVPQNPPFFLKPSSAMIGHGETILIRPDYGLTHPEAELAIVIGRRVKHLTHANALGAVFGYTIINDITSITLKSEDTYVFPSPGGDPPPPGFEWGDMQLTYHARSKGTDTFAPIGPWIMGRDEIDDPNCLGVRVFMGDELVTSDNTANLRYSVQDVLVWASRYFTLEPGDIVHMGTAAAGRYSLRELDLQAWDGPLAVEIDGIGRLNNPIERKDLAGNSVPACARTTSAWPPRYDAAR
ncbi:MAG: fumarylacetoacetate hydrolase family protein [Hyphomonadaceae bacterium]